VILALPIIFFSIQADVASLKDLALMALGAVVGALGAVVVFHFGMET
jgi:hypothetical protein